MVIYLLHTRPTDRHVKTWQSQQENFYNFLLPKTVVPGPGPRINIICSIQTEKAGGAVKGAIYNREVSH